MTSRTHSDRPSPFLVHNAHFFMPGQGKRALDVAIGDGSNAIFLAQKGYYVEGIGNSRETLQRVAHKAESSKVHVKLIAGNPAHMKIQKDDYDLVTCFYFVNRNLVLQMKEALRPEGIVVMESFTQEQLRYSHVAEELILKPKELLFFFKDFNVLKYEENLAQGPRAIASIMAKKVK